MTHRLAKRFPPWICGCSSQNLIQSFCSFLIYSKVNSVQEACAKCFEIHISKFEILQMTRKKGYKKHQTFSFQFFINRSSILMFFGLFFMWFARFQILICETQSIWRKLLVLSWLYPTQTDVFWKIGVSRNRNFVEEMFSWYITGA